ncbi:MAG: galactose mutarotase [Planctomycetia bacterium]|nr:galactose mutarotase [Planctomycetia bacterium]
MHRLPILLTGLLMMSVTTPIQAQGRATFQKVPFGKTSTGEAVDQCILTNKNGMVVKILTYGGIIQELHVPDREGKFADVCLGFSNLEGYLAGHPYFGCITGRVANRIAKGKFTLNGKEYSLEVNNGPNSLHGGKVGFDKKVWQFLSQVDGPDYQGIKLKYVSKDGEENYPGTLTTLVSYYLTDDNQLKIEYEATTDQATPLNLTNHSYFNLTGGKENVLGHKLRLNSSQYTPTDETMIPTGKVDDVAGTPLDFFSKEHTIGERIEQLYSTPAKGYDHNYLVHSAKYSAKQGQAVIEKQDEQIQSMSKRHQADLRFCASVVEPQSGRVMHVLTTEPGVQLYTGNFLDGKLTGKNGVVYQQHAGFCLETQHYPDSINKPQFPTTVLNPGETYRQTTIYAFSTSK